MVTLVLNALTVVEVHFSFSNAGLVPTSVKKWMEEQPETQPGLERRKHDYVKGELSIPPTNRCDGRELLAELEAAGFVMYDARHQVRIHPEKKGVQYETVRFLFSRKLTAKNRIFAVRRPQIREDLQKMFEGAMWRIRAYRNPFFQDGTLVPNEYAGSLNFEARTPFGSRERQVGVIETVLVNPEHEVRVIDGNITLA